MSPSSDQFEGLGLSMSLLQAISEKGYQQPTAIQIKCIPAVLSGKDVLATSRTGTGKSLAFILPILEKLSKGQLVQANRVRSLILVPTRELAIQIGQQVEDFNRSFPLRSVVVFGGVKINPQMMMLRKGADVLIATPGRLLDLYERNAVKFSQMEVLVFDEADKMIDMGFIGEVSEIYRLIPRTCQRLMFSATFSSSVRSWVKRLLKEPIEVSISTNDVSTQTITQLIHPVDKKRKPALLLQLIRKNQWQQVLVFCATKQGVNQLTRYFERKKVSALALHGDKSQSARRKALDAFKNGQITCLVATDLAARGLDIELLPQVINFNLPQVALDYVHRIGRTGRAEKEGVALSLVCADEFNALSAIERLLKQKIPRHIVPEFEPVNVLPPSSLDTRPIKPKKPKKNKKKRILSDDLLKA